MSSPIRPGLLPAALVVGALGGWPLPVGGGDAASTVSMQSEVAAQVPAPSGAEQEKRDAATFYRRALDIQGPSEKKVDLLREATRLDPSVPAYYSEFQNAQREMSDARRDATERAEAEGKEREAKQASQNTRAAAEAKRDQALERRAAGDQAGALKLAQESAELARAAQDNEGARQAAGLVEIIQSDLTFRQNLWRGLGAAALVAAALLVLLLKKRTHKLEMVEGPTPGRMFKLEKELTTIGAVKDDADIVIADEYRKISRVHCQVARSGRHFFLVDCSRNGTFVNGRAIAKNTPVLLHLNDEITICDDVILIYR